MHNTGRKILLVLLAAGVVWAVFAFPHLNDVETGRTPEYPDLQPREYGTPATTVSKMAQAAIERLPGWRVVGAGSGPGGSRIQAAAKVFYLPLECEVIVKVQREGGKSRLTVRSQSPFAPWDFGQNARNIRAFLAELDRTGE